MLWSVKQGLVSYSRLKVVSAIFLFVLQWENPFKDMENVYHFTSKAVFVLKISESLLFSPFSCQLLFQKVMENIIWRTWIPWRHHIIKDEIRNTVSHWNLAPSCRQQKSVEFRPHFWTSCWEMPKEIYFDNNFDSNLNWRNFIPLTKNCFLNGS